MVAVLYGFAVVWVVLETAIGVCESVDAELVVVATVDGVGVAAGARLWGGVFVGGNSAEVFGDYGIGPNHTLPTGGVARFKGGLSVLDFLRVRTWLHLEPGRESEDVARDAAALARLEGLEAHARAAELRLRMED